LINLGSYNSVKWYLKILTIYKLHKVLLNELKKNNVEVLHAQLETSILALGFILSKIQIPVIFTLRGDETRIFQNPVNLEHNIIHLILKSMLRRKNIFITSISNWLIRDFNRKDKSKIEVIHNGVDCSLFKPLNIKMNNNTILYVGRFVTGKGIEDLLEVARDLTDYQFLFAGKGPLEKLINLKNTKNLGFKTRDELIKLYNSSALCIFPSHYEAFGLVCLEAMSCGASVVATRVGFSEYVTNGKDGVIVTPGKVLELKNSIVKLMDNPKLRSTLGKNARKKALKFNINKTAEKYHTLYKKIIVKR